MNLIKDRIVVILDKNFSIIRYVLEKVMLRYSVKFGGLAGSLCLDFLLKILEIVDSIL